MKSSGIKKHSIDVAGRNTSISLEDEFWTSLREIAQGRRETLPQLIEEIDAKRGKFAKKQGKFANLSSALRMFVLRHYRDELDQRGGVVTAPAPSKSIEAHRGH